MEKVKNHGVILGRKEGDYIAGKVSSVIWENRNPSGDWTPYLPPGEWQRSLTSPIADTMSCVTYSALNSIETQEKFLTGQQVDYADRWTAKRSGTTEDGNRLSNVAETIRQEGLVLESEYPDSDYHSWAEYMKNIPEPLSSQLLAKGKKWLAKWEIKYEWVAVNKTSFLHELQHAPLQIVIPGHAVLNFYSPNDVIKYFDSYEPFLKQTYYANVQDALKIVLTLKKKMIIYKQKGNPTLYFPVGTILVPFSTDYVTYLKDFSAATIIELDTGEFIKFKVASGVQVTKR